MPTIQEKIGFLSAEDLADPELFARKLPQILSRGKCAAHRHKEPWAWRAHAYRVGRNPIGLFVWLMNNPVERKNKITNEDEQASDRMTRPAQDFVYAGSPKDRYNAFLASPQWAWVRKMKLRQADFTCQGCGIRGTRRELQVHHLNYDRPWGRESFNDLLVLCQRCHSDEHMDLPYLGDWPTVSDVVDDFWRKI